MRKLFAYNRQDEAFNTIVDCALELGRATFEGKRASDYEDKNRELLASMGKKAVEHSPFEATFEAEGLAAFNRSSVRNNQTVRDNFNAILTQVITAIVPEVVNEDFERYIADIRQVGYGDTARFQIESNDLFKVNDKAEGVRKGVDQPMYDNEYTLMAHPKDISTHIDWYPFASGIFDMGNFALKIARSFEAWIFINVVKGMAKASQGFGAAYTVNGVTPNLWGKLKQRVSAANGGMSVIAIGTEVALSNVSLGGNFQVEIGEEMNKIGYLNQYLGVPLIGLKNVLVPGTVNGDADLVLPDDKIYFIPVGGSRPVKIVFEGNEVAVMYNPSETSDVRMGITVTMRIGVGCVLGAKYGTVAL